MARKNLILLQALANGFGRIELQMRTGYVAKICGDPPVDRVQISVEKPSEVRHEVLVIFLIIFQTIKTLFSLDLKANRSDLNISFIQQWRPVIDKRHFRPKPIASRDLH